MSPHRIGIVGCGNICPIYLENLMAFPETTVVAVTDALPERARAHAAPRGIRVHDTLSELLSDDRVDLVLNLTPPGHHHAVAHASLLAGKHVYNEKPLASDIAGGRELVELAASRELLLGCAPDTFLGAGLATANRALLDGVIGTPVSGVANMLYGGPESWHPDPAFFYQQGAGPLLDMGPYYVTAMLELFGPVLAVTGVARVSHPVRTITSEPRRGQTISVEIPSHVVGVIEFRSGPVVQLTTSFDVPVSALPVFEVHGPGGALRVPDPNTFGGPVELRRPGDDAWVEIPLVNGNSSNLRGLGVVDLLENGECARATGRRGLEVLEILHGILESAAAGRRIEIPA